MLAGPLWLLLPHGEGALYTMVKAGYADITRSALALLPQSDICPRALFTGDSVAFLYPDLITSLRGDFVAGTMLSAGNASLHYTTRQVTTEQGTVLRVRCILLHKTTLNCTVSHFTELHQITQDNTTLHYTALYPKSLSSVQWRRQCAAIV